MIRFPLKIRVLRKIMERFLLMMKYLMPIRLRKIGVLSNIIKGIRFVEIKMVGILISSKIFFNNKVMVKVVNN